MIIVIVIVIIILIALIIGIYFALKSTTPVNAIWSDNLATAIGNDRFFVCQANLKDAPDGPKDQIINGKFDNINTGCYLPYEGKEYGIHDKTKYKFLQPGQYTWGATDTPPVITGSRNSICTGTVIRADNTSYTAYGEGTNGVCYIPSGGSTHIPSSNLQWLHA